MNKFLSFETIIRICLLLSIERCFSELKRQLDPTVGSLTIPPSGLNYSDPQVGSQLSFIIKHYF